PRAVADAVAPAGTVALRDVLAEAAAVARTAGSAGTTGTMRQRELSLLAERTLRADPASRPLQDAAAAFTRAAAFAARGDTAGARRVLDDATIALAAALRAPLVRAGAADASPVLAGVRGRLVDALRGRRGNP
ncbi:MAG: hypothetical protein U9Q74_08400, partial [Gemmatimonadota bacterium]|nr:hypothetical protein [Gemmatimonadota bacterium]